MNDLARFEVFAPGFNGQREVSRFWISGPLDALETRARHQAHGRPSPAERVLALSIAMAAIATVLTLL